MALSSGFRSEVREWLEAHCPPAMRTLMPSSEVVWGGRKASFPRPEAREWLLAVAAKGWLAPTWTKEYGGAGLSAEEAECIAEEMRLLGCRPPLMSLGIHMMGPTILEFGNEEQKREHLPKIARGEIRWCQGYSEPGAGSDLASLQCRATPEGEDYLVTGQKIWTSYADKSDFLFCLVRTDFSAKKQEGISVLLIDMDSPGVSTRPIELISGSSHFCQVFLDEVRVPARNLLGEKNRGWTIAKRMLEHERNMMGSALTGKDTRPDLLKAAANYRPCAAELRAAIARNEMQIRAVDLTAARVQQEVASGEGSMAAPVLKYAMTVACQERFDLLQAVMGVKGLGWEASSGSFTPDEISSARNWAFSRIQTIGGGTSEVQLNILAKFVLGLPER